MNSTLNRRAAMTALATGAAVALVPAAAMASPTPAGIRPEFLKAEQLFRWLEAESGNYEDTVHEPIRLRFIAAADAIPHTSVTIDGATWTTAKPGHVSVARRIVGGDRNHRDVPEVRDMRRLVAAHLRRERAVARLPERQASQLSSQRCERLSNESCAAEDAFYAMHPTSMAELTRKLRVMIERERDWEGCVAGIILPDVLALTTREG